MHPWTPPLSNTSVRWRCGLILNKKYEMVLQNSRPEKEKENVVNINGIIVN